MRRAAAERLYTRAEAARKLGIVAATLTQRALRGHIPDGAVIRTPGGTRRYRADVIDAMAPGYLKPGAAGKKERQP